MELKQGLYRVLELLTRGHGIARKINSERIRFPAKWCRYYESDYEIDTFAFLRANLIEGDTFLDIGGHIGLFAVVASKIVGEGGKVFTFEPTPFTREVLHPVIEINGCSHNTEICSYAVSSHSGETVFFDTGDVISNANSLVRTSRSRGEIPVKVTSIDDFVNARQLAVKALKIDVEGAELDVLKGAATTLRTQRPVVRLGLHPESVASNGHSLEMIWTLIGTHHYLVEYRGKLMNAEQFCSQPTLFDVNLIPSKTSN